jgi:hypothetical protein
VKIFVFKNHENEPFNPIFQIRWKETLGNKDCPYLYRWTIIFLNYSFRIHHWIKSDDNRYFHDHSSNLISMIIKGWYYNVIPLDPDKPDVNNSKKIYCKAWYPWYAKATAKHYLEIPKAGAWTLLLEGRPYHKWGFYVNNHKWRPSRYFSKFGIIQTRNYQ